MSKKEEARAEIDIALTRGFGETVAARAQRDPKFRQALFTEAINAYLAGDTQTGNLPVISGQSPSLLGKGRRANSRPDSPIEQE